MALANVALTDTFDIWRVRTNQIIVALDQANSVTYNASTISNTGFAKANASNVLAYNVSIGANNYANYVGSSVNSYSVITSTNASNNWANLVSTASNNRTTTLTTAGNTYAALVGFSANSYTDQQIVIINSSMATPAYANTVGARSNAWSNSVGSYANTYALIAIGYANNYANVTGTRSNTWANSVGSSANLYANYVGVSSNGFTSVVGAAANTLSSTKLANTSGVTFAGSLYFPTNSTVYTGTGSGSIYITNNQINSGYNYNAGDGTLSINYTGYNAGTTQFRNLYIYDGKSNSIATFVGSDKSLYVYGDVQAYYSSDISLKENITTITDAVAKVNSIRGVEFDWTDDYLAKKGNLDGYFIRKRDIGVIAQELEKVLPEAVGVREDGIKAVKYERIVPLLIEAIKGLSSEIEELKKGR